MGELLMWTWGLGLVLFLVVLPLAAVAFALASAPILWIAHLGTRVFQISLDAYRNFRNTTNP